MTNNPRTPANDAPETIWIDALGVPKSDKYAGTYYLSDDDDHLTFQYTRTDIAEARLALMAMAVERAFKDGVRYGTLVCVETEGEMLEAWLNSSVRSASIKIKD